MKATKEPNVTTALATIPRGKQKGKWDRHQDTNAASKAMLVAALRLGTTISGACITCGVATTTYYYWLDNDPIFCDDVTSARAAGRCKRAQYYEDLLLMRAQEGDIAATIFALKSLSPDIYRERKEIFTAPVPKVYLNPVMEEI